MVCHILEGAANPGLSTDGMFVGTDFAGSEMTKVHLASSPSVFLSKALESVRRAPSIEFKVKQRLWVVRSAPAINAQLRRPFGHQTKGVSRCDAGEHPAQHVR